MFERITINPAILSGQACIRGLRIPVHLIVEMVASSMTRAAILRAYPDLEAEDIRAALEYAAYLTRERVLPIQVAG